MSRAPSVENAPGAVILINGHPCSGKSTLAEAVQAEMTEPWLHLDLDTFAPKLPPQRTWSEPAALRRIIAGANAAVTAVVEAGNNVLVEFVARDDPGASLVLDDLFQRLARFEPIVISARCSLDTALQREAIRPPAMQGLVKRDYGHVDDRSFDIAVETDTLSIPEQVSQVRRALAIGPTGGLDRLHAAVHARCSRQPFEAKSIR